MDMLALQREHRSNASHAQASDAQRDHDISTLQRRVTHAPYTRCSQGSASPLPSAPPARVHEEMKVLTTGRSPGPVAPCSTAVTTSMPDSTYG